MAVVCALHAQAVTDELSLDPTLLARYFRKELSLCDLEAHLREATESAVWEAVRLDVLDECARRNERAAARRDEDFYGSAQRITMQEQAERDFGVRALFRGSHL